MDENVGGSHGNMYDVEHLATFGLSEELSFPADGMRRLLHMEKNGFGIWSQKMRIRLEHRYIVIVDFENGDEMERFPLQLIRDPTAFTNSNPGELYNNIFAFIVNPVEMHIFQCFNISAADLVEDVKIALSGRLPPNRQRHGSQTSLPPPPVNPPPEPPMFRVDGEDSRDDTSSLGSEGKYEREVSILNRCFDDIERFIARLQYAAAAYRDLQRRRKSKKSKKKDHGEGLLSMRARPPREREFVDILQKFKLSFNLLARLKSHIHDPNAPELVHFLFTPLALIVDAATNAHAAGLASRVVSPLLCREAIELLNNCLTSKETELWHSLGEAWLVSREQWKGYVDPYQPIFMDGWSPMIQETNAIGASIANEAQRRLQEIRSAQAQQEAQQMRRADREMSISPVEMMSDDFSSGQRAFVDSVRSRGGRVVVVTHPRTANNHKELTVVRGEYLEVMDDTKKWWKARNWKGVVAHVPHTIVAPVNDFPQEGSSYHQHHQQDGRAGNWSSPNLSYSSDEDGGRNNGMKEASPPPPPPPPSVGKSLPPRASKSGGKRAEKPHHPAEDNLIHQLKNVLREREKHLDIAKTPEVYINQHSSSSEVREWLLAKGFSDKITKQLANMDGNELFALKRNQLEEVCGPKEGKRLDSQITISRSVSGYKTVRTLELGAILAKHRAKVDQGRGDDEEPNFKTTAANTKANAKTIVPIVIPKAAPVQSYTNSNGGSRGNYESKFDSYDPDSETDLPDSDSDDGKSTLGRMLKEKRGQILRK